jgi:hypothetical protein
MKTIMAVFSCAAIIDIILRLYLMRENARREKMGHGAGGEETDSSEPEDIDLTDRENLSFRYVL